MAPAVLGAVFVLSGCASSPKPFPQLAQKPESTPLNTSGEEAASRTRARVHTELAAGYYELRNMPVALEEVKHAIKAEPGYGPAYNIAGLIYAELREDRLAQENFERALRLDPLDSDANNNYGRFLCERKREGDALKYFVAALRNPLYQTRENSYVNAGMCLRRSGDVKAAEDYFQRALKVRPTQPQALYHLADIGYARGDYEQAKQYVIRLEQLTNPTAEMLWLALRIERRLGDRNAVASYAQQLRSRFPDSKEARALLAGLDE
jgi:type IV pilus assembly protein PilF